MTKKTMSTAKQRRIGVLLSYISMGVSIAASLVYTPYMLRCLGQSEYGLYQLIGSFANYLSLLSLGLSSSYIRFYNIYLEDKGEEGVKELNGMYAFAFCIITCVSILVGLCLTVNIHVLFQRTMTEYELGIGRIMMLLTTVNAAITFPRTVFIAFIAANEKFVFQRLLILAHSIINPCICIIALWLGGKAVTLVWLLLISSALLLAAETYYSIKELKFRIRFKTLKWSSFLPIFSFSVVILINDIINQVNWSVDKVILGAVSGTIAVSVYGVASQLNSHFFSISVAISSVYAPQVNQIAASALPEEQKKRQFNEIFVRVGKIQSWIILLVITGYVFFGKQFILMWAGAEYGQSYYVGLWIMIPAAISLFQNTGIEIQRALGKHRIRSIVYSIIAIINILISIPLGKAFGAVGCAVGTALSLIAGDILFMNWYYYKRLQIDIPFFWKRILTIVPALVLPGVFGIWIKRTRVFDSYLAMGLWIILYVLIYCISLYLFALRREEKKTIKTFFLHLFHKGGTRV